MKHFKRFLPVYLLVGFFISANLLYKYFPDSQPRQPLGSTAIAEMCWNLEVSLTDRPVSSSVIWTLGEIANIDDQHAAVVGSYASQRELTPEARQGLCTSLSKLPVPAQASTTPKAG
ncbi:hypothetical protein [Pseudomonas serbica]|uniref:hypothetical protein n=1 Tax=Pseudomonas serbica TaxID=2965074 RepID=UPI00237BB957|nr:hypothetical protein [Pseudomonas serbica]